MGAASEGTELPTHLGATFIPDWKGEMALKSCSVTSCKNKMSRRDVFCSKCWARLPRELRADIRKGTEDGSHTLRSHPSKEWMANALRFVSNQKVAGANESVISSVLTVE
jgi:hypothetical protein